MRVRKTSRSATADRKSLSWEEVGGGREGEEGGGGGGGERGEREREKIRRPSLHSAEETRDLNLKNMFYYSFYS